MGKASALLKQRVLILDNQLKHDGKYNPDNVEGLVTITLPSIIAYLEIIEEQSALLHKLIVGDTDEAI